MKKTDSPFSGKILLGKRKDRIRELEEFEAERRRLLADLKLVDGQIAACRAYIRELDIRAGDLPDDRRLKGKVSIRDMVLQILADAEMGLTVTELRKAMEGRFGRTVERPSISPILSRMRDGGEIRQEEDARWAKVKLK